MNTKTFISRRVVIGGEGFLSEVFSHYLICSLRLGGFEFFICFCSPCSPNSWWFFSLLGLGSLHLVPLCPLFGCLVLLKLGRFSSLKGKILSSNPQISTYFQWFSLGKLLSSLEWFEVLKFEPLLAVY